MTVNFNFAVGDPVVLKEIDRPAVVTGVLYDDQGKQYRVVYWDNGTRKCEWLFAFEIAPAAK